MTSKVFLTITVFCSIVIYMFSRQSMTIQNYKEQSDGYEINQMDKAQCDKYNEMNVNMSDEITLEIGGTIFKTQRSTLGTIEESYLATLDQGHHKFDRDPHLFRHVLSAFREKNVHVPRDVCPIVFKEELLFWNIPLTLIKPCCWKYFYDVDKDVETFKILIKNDNKFDGREDVRDSIKRAVFDDKDPKRECLDRKANKADQENALWLFLNEPGYSFASRIWCFFYIAVVVLSIIVYVVLLDPRVRVPRYLVKATYEWDIYANEKLYENLTTMYQLKGVLMFFSDPHPVVLTADLFCVAFFIVETVLHFCACPEKSKYAKNVYHLLKIKLCIAMIISTTLEMRKDWIFGYTALGYVFFFSKAVNVLRLLLIFRLHRIYNRLHLVILSLQQSCKELALLLFSFLIVVIVYGCLIFSVEIDSEMFPSTYISMWWSLITMTTIGYGDLYPTTTAGYVVGVLCAVNGIIVLALPVASIVGTFSNLFARNEDFQKHKEQVSKQIHDNRQSPAKNIFTE